MKPLNKISRAINLITLYLRQVEEPGELSDIIPSVWYLNSNYTGV